MTGAAALFLLSALVAGTSPTSEAPPITCTADLGLMGMGDVSVVVATREGGAIQAHLNGELTNESVAISDDRIDPDLDLRLDPYSDEFESLNAGEQSLVHMRRLLDDTRAESIIELPFDLAAVSRVRAFDLTGSTDKFGGTVLLEAYGADGALLGRVLRHIMVASCE